MRGGEGVHLLGEFVRFPGKLENVCFQVFGKPEKLAPGAGSPTSVSQISPSRARSETNILAVPDGSGGPPEASGPTRMFFRDRVREGAELVTG